MVGFMDRERVPYSAVSEGSTLTITWSSMSGKGGDATGTVKRVSRGGVADSDGLNEFMLVTENGMRYKVYVDAGAYEGGRTNPPVERFTDAGVESLGSLTGIYEPED